MQWKKVRKKQYGRKNSKASLVENQHSWSDLELVQVLQIQMKKLMLHNYLENYCFLLAEKLWASQSQEQAAQVLDNKDDLRQDLNGCLYGHPSERSL